MSSCPSIQDRLAEQFVDIPLPHIMEEMMKVVLIIPRKRQNRTVEQIVDVSIPQVEEKIVEVIGRPPRANTPVAGMVTSPRRRLRWTILWIRRARALRTRRRAVSSWSVWTWTWAATAIFATTSDVRVKEEMASETGDLPVVETIVADSGIFWIFAG